MPSWIDIDQARHAKKCLKNMAHLKIAKNADGRIAGNKAIFLSKQGH